MVLSGCSKSGGGDAAESGNSTGDNGTTGKPASISVFAPQGSDADLNTNWFSKQMEDKFNIKFTWQTTTYDASSASEKRKISLASGDYPDLYLLVPWVDHFSQAELLKYGKQGVIIPLNDLINEYAPHVVEAINTHPYYKAMLTAPDGNIYGIPQLNECYHCTYEAKMWLNTDWLKKLNLEMPATTEDFKKVLEAFKTKDPNGNGKADEVPISGSVNWNWTSPVPFLMNAFIYDDDQTYLLMDNGKVEFAPNKEGWRQGLEYLHSLYQEGLIDPGAFTQNADAYLALGDNAEAPILGAGPAMHPGIFLSDKSRLYADVYNPVAPLKGPDGTSYATYNYPSSPGGDFVLTNKASKEAQIAAIKVLDYMYTTEGATEGYLGKEGLDWRKPQEGEKAIEDGVQPLYATIPAKDGEAPHNSAWGAMAQYYHNKAYRDGIVQDTDIYKDTGYERRLQEATHLYDGKEPSEVFPHWATWVDPSEADEVSMLRTNIQSYIQQNTSQFIMGKKDLNKDWDSYVNGFEKLNLKRYLDIMQAEYDQYKKSSGN
ncbi:extracellular solute-binding protein [Cohnella sp. CBP 2801]|uniref:Extracellular solute-binding protein n=2 Tax=Cohnella zeiphila TaxID=2761120 RepID=A0A7X0VXW6_9BACL|nr:extracellular solute-binding protein [Cohnella zeiphila]MBB6734739.1 extracellular solute-binding protein [Cohnella zeiphila]